MGPRHPTFVCPAEIFSIRVQSSAHDIAAGLGKIGASVAAFAFPYLLTAYHIRGVMAFAAVVTLLGLLLERYTSLLPMSQMRITGLWVVELAGKTCLVFQGKQAGSIVYVAR